jgi:AraC-like DNA-binding protein
MEIMLSGKAVHTLNNTSYTIERGDVFLLSFYDYHAISALEDVDHITLSFLPNAPDKRISDFLESSGKPVCFRLDEENLEFFLEKIKHLEKELSDGKQMSKVMSSSLLSELLIFSFRCANSNPDVTKPLLVQKATAYIHANFKEDITLDKLAQHLGVSTGYLGKSLKNSLGKSFNDYLSDVRLKRACNLLESSGMSVSDISAASGFSSATYFLYVFKKRFGVTPGEYKKTSAVQSPHQ